MLRGMLSQSHMMLLQASFTHGVSAYHTTPRVLGLYLGGCAELRADSAKDISRARCSASSSV